MFEELTKDFNDMKEKIFFAKVLDKAEICLKRHSNTCTDFLEPTRIKFYENQLNTIRDIKYKIFGGYEEAERKVICFYPDYTELEYNDFPIDAIKIQLNSKFSDSINHRHYLGSILNTGIERSKLGDIVVIDNYAIAFIKRSISEYVLNNLIKVSNIRANVSLIDLKSLQLPQKKYKIIKTTVPSLRIDAIISSAFNISRAKASQFINAEKVNLNWICVKSGSITLKQGDIFSLKGYGRARLEEIAGKTRKDRIAVLIYIYV